MPISEDNKYLLNLLLANQSEEDDQSYWTDWYQHYELTNILHK